MWPESPQILPSLPPDHWDDKHALLGFSIKFYLFSWSPGQLAKVKGAPGP